MPVSPDGREEHRPGLLQQRGLTLVVLLVGPGGEKNPHTVCSGLLLSKFFRPSPQQDQVVTVPHQAGPFIWATSQLSFEPRLGFVKSGAHLQSAQGPAVHRGMGTLGLSGRISRARKGFLGSDCHLTCPGKFGNGERVLNHTARVLVSFLPLHFGRD